MGTAPAFIAENRRARFDYHVEERHEAGMVLEGWEIKAVRAGQVQLTDGYVVVRDGELWLIGCRINALRNASTHVQPEADRTRKLLLHKEEIKRLIGKIEQKGYTLVPLDLHFKDGRVKAEIALAKGKAEHDKRDTEKKRDWEREKGRLMRHKVSGGKSRAAGWRRGREQRPGRAAERLRELDELPSPPGVPLLGNLLGVSRPRIHAQVEAWARRHGSLFTIRLGANRLLVIADHVAMAAVLRDRPEGFRRTPRLAQISQELGLAGGVFGAEGEAWKRQRRMVMAGFDPRHLRAYFPSLVTVAGRLDRRWRDAAAGRRAIDLQADLMRFTVDAISGLAFGADINTLESDDDVIQRHLDKIFPALFHRLLAPLPLWRWWKSPADRRLDRSVQAVNGAIVGFVAAARARLAADPARRDRPANLLEAMLVAAADEGSGITDHEVSGNVMTMLLAGEDTTANTLAWMVWLLHRHPASLARARDEIDRVAGPASGWTPERFAALDYVEACAHETMRLKPVAPSLVLQALRDTTIADVRVPARTLVWGALRADSLEDRFFADAAAFRPERWLENGAAPGAYSAHRVSMPFGAGPRVCPGRQLAITEMKMALAVLLGGFEIEAVRTAGGGEPEERLSFTMAPEPLTMHLRRRTAGAQPQEERP